MTEVEAVVQRYYGDRPVLQRIDDALRAAGVDPERPSHRDLWPFDQLHSRGIVGTREHAERARIEAGMYVLDVGCGLGGASRYLAADSSCRVASIDLTPNFVEAARILTARCGLSHATRSREDPAKPRSFRCPGRATRRRVSSRHPRKCAPLLKQGACPYSSRSMSPQLASERPDGSRS